MIPNNSATHPKYFNREQQVMGANPNSAQGLRKPVAVGLLTVPAGLCAIPGCRKKPKSAYSTCYSHWLGHAKDENERRLRDQRHARGEQMLGLSHAGSLNSNATRGQHNTVPWAFQSQNHSSIRSTLAAAARQATNTITGPPPIHLRPDFMINAFHPQPQHAPLTLDQQIWEVIRQQVTLARLAAHQRQQYKGSAAKASPGSATFLYELKTGLRALPPFDIPEVSSTSPTPSSSDHNEFAVEESPVTQVLMKLLNRVKEGKSTGSDLVSAFNYALHQLPDIEEPRLYLQPCSPLTFPGPNLPVPSSWNDSDLSIPPQYIMEFPELVTQDPDRLYDNLLGWLLPPLELSDPQMSGRMSLNRLKRDRNDDGGERTESEGATKSKRARFQL